MKEQAHIIEKGRILKNLLDKQILTTMKARMPEYTTVQMQVINYISTNDDKIVRQKDLQEVLGVSKPTINGIIRRLIDKGAVELKPLKNDRRSKQVVLSKQMLAERSARKVEYLDDLDIIDKIAFKGIDESQQEKFYQILNQVIDNLSN